MYEVSLHQIASFYASHSLSVVPALPRSKEPAVSWKAFQWQPPSDSEREALFSINCNLNIGVVCGAASNNLIAIDCETRPAFEETLRNVKRIGYSETWTVASHRGGHIYLHLPTPVKPIGKNHDVEVRAQGQFVLLPPSIHPAGGSYDFINFPSSIARVESLREIDWLHFEQSSAVNQRLPRKAYRLLQGKSITLYRSRSEAEQAIITILVNDGLLFEQILWLFKKYPAAGKFRDIELRESPQRAIAWLRTSFEIARGFCSSESRERVFARERLDNAMNTPWPGRTGSLDRAVFCAHASLAYRAGGKIYHASSRDLAESAGCQRATASTATRRLLRKGLVRLVNVSVGGFANRYRLEHPKVSENDPLTTQPCEGVAQTSSFLLPDAFRRGGLGRTSYEVIVALKHGPLTVSDLAAVTGRHVQSIRLALKKMRPYGFVSKEPRRIWRGCAMEDIVARSHEFPSNGALDRQREKHQRERIRCKLTRAVLKHLRSQGMR